MRDLHEHPGDSSRGGDKAPPTYRTARREAFRRLSALKKRAIVASIVGFGGLIGLAAHHPYGVTAQAASPQRTQSADTSHGSSETWDQAATQFFDQESAGGYGFDDVAPPQRAFARSRFS